VRVFGREQGVWSAQAMAGNVAINIAAFGDVSAFKERVDVVWDTLKTSPLLPSVNEILLPGERSARIYKDRITNGIPVAFELQSALDQLADRIAVERLRAWW